VTAFAAARWADLCTKKNKKVLRDVQRAKCSHYPQAHYPHSVEITLCNGRTKTIDLFLKERKA